MRSQFEGDGYTHSGRERYDQARDVALTALGFKVVRFADDRVLGNPHIVNAQIHKRCLPSMPQKPD
jgi:very-short-patch-repair endonuclease